MTPSRLPQGVVPLTPASGQESVWDYPRPPRLDPVSDHVVVCLGGIVVCDTTASIRVLETSHPPAYYLPRADWVDGSLLPVAGTSVCEYKGLASYFTIVGGDSSAERAGWTYEQPYPGFESIAGYVSVYPDRLDSCTVDGELVHGQEGGFYGGWVTDRVVGPFKGVAGSWGW